MERPFAELAPELSQSHQKRLEEFIGRAVGEYRAASVLLADIAGSGSFTRRFPAEKVKREILDPFYALCVQAVDFHNGFVVKFMGDGCLAVFGAPVAFGRDTESAVRAALQIRDRARVYPWPQGAPVQLRITIDTGEILSAVNRAKIPPEYDITGAPVNIAARLKTSAKPGQILITEGAHGLVGGSFDCRGLGSRRFKDRKQAIRIFEVLGAKKTALVMPRDFPTAFVGRLREFQRLEQAWDGFLAQQRAPEEEATFPRGIILTGEPGIGKTRLALEFSIAHEREARVLIVDGCPYGGKLPWGLWRSILSDLAGESRGEPQDRTSPELSRFLGKLGYAPEEQIPFKALFGSPEALKALSPLSPPNLQQLLGASLRGLLERLTRERPLLLILDDLQWADRASLEALDALLSGAPLRGVFFFLAHRNEFALKGAGFQGLDRLRLYDLDQASRSALFDLLAAMHEFLPEAREGLIRKAEGNPFYLMELVHALARELQERGGEAPPEEVKKMLLEWAPSSLREMVQSRIDLLDHRRKQVLQCAAVLGRRFAFQIIELFDLIRQGLLARLYSLESLQFLEDLITPQGLEFLFRHEVTREVAYHSLLESQRRDLHRFVAERLEEKFADRLGDVCPMLAYHFDQSDDHERAAHYLKLAGDRATALGAADDAIENYSAALEHLKADQSGKESRLAEIAILRSRGRIQRLAGRQKQALQSFRPALALARKNGKKDETALLLAEIGLTFIHTSDYEEAEKALNGSLRAVGKAGEPGLLGMVFNGLGVCAWGRGLFEAARPQFEKARALDLARRNPSLAADARNNLALLEWKAGRLAEAAALFREALALRHKANDKFGIALTLMNLGIIEENQGRDGSAEQHYHEALTLAGRIQFAQVVAAAHANLANLRLTQGRGLEALEHSAKSLEAAERIGDRRSAAIALENLALSHVALRQFAEARQSLRKGRQLARLIGDRERLFSLELAEIELLLTEGTTEALEPRLQRAFKALDRNGYAAERPRLLRLQAHASLLAGRIDEAGETVQEALRECVRQQNRGEERRLRTLERDFD